ncbi:hypothetical protein [Agrobacterium radiobacter]|jgi:hypothetical protein|uniref:hypothetical protein n=1 Tax=Agrobacterium radiobacter TaxID=362 RepID=UPI0013AFB057|nr:hypothetical protein [Agrobacterium radiobacter]MBB4406805.1 hypothetical protein [Agrobacterium radiobacter]MBB4449786.1 hypothetical protein [Agrobacterium radiobacter]
MARRLNGDEKEDGRTTVMSVRMVLRPKYFPPNDRFRVTPHPFSLVKVDTELSSSELGQMGQIRIEK